MIIKELSDYRFWNVKIPNLRRELAVPFDTMIVCVGTIFIVARVAVVILEALI